MIITLRQMQYAIAVAETGSFSKAAEICFADQSTVSQQIKTFEDKLGVQLFDRTTLPVKVTEEGDEIISQSREIIQKVEDLIAPFKLSKRKALQ
ncbi:MAG: LysR family transcriptional regulator [Cytophagales bacterium]